MSFMYLAGAVVVAAGAAAVGLDAARGAGRELARVGRDELDRLARMGEL